MGADLEDTPRVRRATDSDVAREAGVSRATVYYVLNDDPKRRITDATRARVLDAVERLNYVPFGPARLLRGGRSSVVLLLTHGLQHATDLVATHIVTRLGAALEERGLHLVWQLDGEDSREPSIDLAPVAVLSSSSPGERAYDQAAAEYSVPVLEAFPGLTDFVAAAAHAQVDHLAATGRSRLAFVTRSDRDVGSTADIRWRGVVAAARRRNLAEPIRAELPGERAAAARSLSELLVQHPELDGFCAVNDEAAFLLLAAASDAGIPVPSRVAVVGVDGHPFGTSSIPALSTVTTDIGTFVEALAQRIAETGNTDEADEVALPTRAQVIRRDSS